MKWEHQTSTDWLLARKEAITATELISLIPDCSSVTCAVTVTVPLVKYLASSSTLLSVFAGEYVTVVAVG